MTDLPYFELFGLTAAALVALRATNWATDGFWSPSGGYVYVLLLAGLSWIVVASVLLSRATPAAGDLETVAPAG